MKQKKILAKPDLDYILNYLDNNLGCFLFKFNYKYYLYFKDMGYEDRGFPRHVEGKGNPVQDYNFEDDELDLYVSLINAYEMRNSRDISLWK